MCKYEEIEGWRLSNGKTIREIKREKLAKTIKVLASFLFSYTLFKFLYFKILTYPLFCTNSEFKSMHF